MLLDPFVVKDTFQVEAMRGLIFQQLADNIASSVCNVLRKPQVDAKQKYILACEFLEIGNKEFYLQILWRVVLVSSSLKGGSPTRNL